MSYYNRLEVVLAQLYTYRRNNAIAALFTIPTTTNTISLLSNQLRNCYVLTAFLLRPIGTVAVSVDSITNIDSSTLLSLEFGVSLGLVFLELLELRNLLMYSTYLAFYILFLGFLGSTDQYIGRALALLATIIVVGANLPTLLQQYSLLAIYIFPLVIRLSLRYLVMLVQELEQCRLYQSIQCLVRSSRYCTVCLYYLQLYGRDNYIYIAGCIVIPLDARQIAQPIRSSTLRQRYVVTAYKLIP